MHTVRLVLGGTQECDLVLCQICTGVNKQDLDRL